jgi:hypothetical protein
MSIGNDNEQQARSRSPNAVNPANYSFWGKLVWKEDNR